MNKICFTCVNLITRDDPEDSTLKSFDDLALGSKTCELQEYDPDGDLMASTCKHHDTISDEFESITIESDMKQRIHRLKHQGIIDYDGVSGTISRM